MFPATTHAYRAKEGEMAEIWKVRDWLLLMLSALYGPTCHLAARFNNPTDERSTHDQMYALKCPLCLPEFAIIDFPIWRRFLNK